MSKSYTAPDLDHSSTRRLTWTWPQQQEQDQQIPSNIDCYQTAPDQGFPIRLHYLLSQVDGDGDAHIVSWQVCKDVWTLRSGMYFFRLN